MFRQIFCVVVLVFVPALASAQSEPAGTVPLGSWSKIYGVQAQNDEVMDLALSPAGNLLATSGLDKAVCLRELSSGRLLHRLEHSGIVGRIAFTNDGNILATSGGQENEACLWDVRTGNLLAKLQHPEGTGVGDVQFSQDSTLLATAPIRGSGLSNFEIRIWEIPSGTLKQTLKGHTHSVSKLLFTADDQTLVSGSEDKTIRLWKVSDGKQLAVRQHKAPVTSLAYDGVKNRVISSGSKVGHINLWDATGKPDGILKGEATPLQCLAISSSGRLLAGSNQIRINPNKRPTEKSKVAKFAVRIWDTSTSATKFELKGHTNIIWCMAFSPDTSLLATGSFDKTVCLWDTSSGRLLQTLEGYERPVTNLVFNKEGNVLATTSRDGRLYLWSRHLTVATVPQIPR